MNREYHLGGEFYIYRYFKRAIALSVLIAFAVTNTITSPALAAPKSQAPISSPKPLPIDLNEIQVPIDIGSVHETFQGTEPETVILIQDAHAIPDAQRNIQKVINHFQTEYGVRLVALEGASSKLDPQIFKSFPDQALLRELFQTYFERGELTGGNAAAIFNESESAYYGIEDWDLFEAGLAPYLRAMQAEPKLLSFLTEKAAQLKSDKKQVYSAELYELDQLLERFYDNDEDLMVALKALSKIQQPDVDSELALLIAESGKEDTTDTEAQIEVRHIADTIERFLKLSSQNQKALIQFNQKRQAFQTSRITLQSFALYLTELMSQHDLPLQLSERLSGFVAAQRRIRNLKGTALFEGFEVYANAVKQSLMQSDKARALDIRSAHLRLLKRLIQLEISFQDWSEVKRQFQTQAALAPHIQFYENTLKRDKALYRNMYTLMQKEKTQSGILVAGGFHTSGLTEQFKAQGISYLVVVPQINSIPESTQYREHMKGNVSWKEHFRVENGSVNLYEAFVRGTRDRLIREAKITDPASRDTFHEIRDTRHTSRLLKYWRDEIIRDLADQNRLVQAGQYTHFLDEISSSTVLNLSKDNLASKIETFISGLRHLKATDQLTEQKILSLIHPATRPADAISAALTSKRIGSIFANLIVPSEPIATTFEIDVQELEERLQMPGTALTGKPELPLISDEPQSRTAPALSAELRNKKEVDAVNKLIHEIAVRLSERQTFVKKREKITVEIKQAEITSILRDYQMDIVANFLAIVQIYLKNEIPDASLFKGFDLPLLDTLTSLTGKFHLWTKQAIKEFARHLQTKMDEVEQRTKQVPVVIEVAAGHADLTYGLKRVLPSIRIIATDGFYSEELEEGEILYDLEIIEARGVEKLTTDDIENGSFRQKLKITEDTPVLIIATHLPLEGDAERSLLNQRNVDDLILITAYKPQSHRKGSGNRDLMANDAIWDVRSRALNPKIWFSGLLSFEGRIELNLETISRVENYPKEVPGAVSRPSSGQLPENEWIIAGGAPVLSGSTGWFERVMERAERKERKTFGQLLDSLKKPITYQFERRKPKPSDVPSWQELWKAKAVSSEDWLNILSDYIGDGLPEQEELVQIYEKTSLHCLETKN